MKIKVATKDLIALVGARRTRDREAHDKQVEAYLRDEPSYRERLVRELRSFADALEGGAPLPTLNTERRYSRGRQGRLITTACVPVKARPPLAPMQYDERKLRERIRELRLTSAAELNVDLASSEWRAYV